MVALLDDADVQQAFATHLRRLRKQAKLSRDALAARSGVPASTIKTLGKLTMNFHSFSRFFLNALQETNIYPKEEYSKITIDENLVILNQNFNEIARNLNNFLHILM